MSDTKRTTGECGRCKGAVYHDGLNWRHVENDRPLRECPLQTPDFRDLVLRDMTKYFVSCGLDGDEAGRRTDRLMEFVDREAEKLNPSVVSVKGTSLAGEAT